MSDEKQPAQPNTAREPDSEDPGSDDRPTATDAPGMGTQDGERTDHRRTEPGAAAPAAELEQHLMTARQEIAETQGRLARVQADFENYRRRAQREREEAEQYAHLAFARSILPVLDNLDRALDTPADTGATGDEALRAGLDLTRRQFREALAKMGIEAVAAQGQPFDPNWHEAVARVPGEHDTPTVVEEFQKGYRLGNRLVRPSMVKVAARD